MSDQTPSPEQAPPAEVSGFAKGCIVVLILLVLAVVGAAIILGGAS